jgi:hypothetical protein
MPRYECDDPAFAGNFVEYSDAWSLAQINAMVGASLAELVPLAAKKVTGLHLETLDGEPLTEAGDLTNDALEDVDLRLYYWLTGTFARVTGDVGRLGEALRRTLFVSSVETTDGAPPAA